MNGSSSVAEYELPSDAKYLIKRFIKSLSVAKPQNNEIFKYAADWFVAEYLDQEISKNEAVLALSDTITGRHIGDILTKISQINTRTDNYIPQKPLLDVVEIVGVPLPVMQALLPVFKMGRGSDVYIVEAVTVLMLLARIPVPEQVDLLFAHLGQASGPTSRIPRRLLHDYLAVAEGYGLQVLDRAGLQAVRDMRVQVNAVPAGTMAIEHAAVRAWLS